MSEDDELQVKCPLCDARKGRACDRHEGTGSHPERTVELMLHRARHAGEEVNGYDLWERVMKASGEIPEGRRQIWERHYLPEVKRLCGFG